jgi:hypothetical protein
LALVKEPHLSDALTRHFGRYKILPVSLATKLIEQVIEEGVYHSVNADLLNLLYGRVKGADRNKLADFSYERLFARKYRTRAVPAPQPTYRAALIKWALLSSRITYIDVEGLLQHERDWWVRQELIVCLDESRFGRPSFEALLNIALRGADPDPARVAASVIFDISATVAAPHSQCHWAARLLLRNVGLLAYAGRPPSQISGILEYVAKLKIAYDWQRLFGADHNLAERLAITAKQRFETDIDAFIVSFDSFCDLLTRKICEHRGHVFRTTYGNALASGAPAWFRSDFPVLMGGFGRLHGLRIRSLTAHPRHRTGAPNKRISIGSTTAFVKRCSRG